jgi:glycyl-tRNA synthetase beta chain
MPQLLLEIGAEEIPANAVLPALQQMEEMMGRELKRLRLAYGEIATYATHRRLAIVVKRLAENQPDQEVEHKGPPVERAFTEEGDPTDAAIGFAKARGVDVSDLAVRETDKGSFVFATVQEEGKATLEVLPSLLTEMIASLEFPKTMRWGELEMRFVRPIRWLVALLGAEVVPIQVADLTSGRVTHGHRALHPEPVELTDAGEYLQKLENAYVIADHRRRRREIVEQAEAVAAEVDAAPVLRKEIVDENNFLVEWPTCLLGQFDERYLELPDEVIATVMEKHQSYFPVVPESGSLLARFIVVANIAADAGPVVRTGHEKVIAARLADAEFYVNEDTKRSPDEAREELRRVTFLGNLGTLYDKTMRLEILVKWLCQRQGVDGEIVESLQRAAAISKIDQISQMVGDTKLADLQGIIGGYYAAAAGENQTVSEAIAEQYKPVSADGELPTSPGGAVLSVADRIDNIAAAFYLGMEPTGTKDPMGLRRQSQGLIAICLERSLHFSLPDVVSLVMGLLPDLPNSEMPDVAEAGLKLREFIAGRIENLLEVSGVGYDIVRAALGTPWDDTVEVITRAKALAEIRAHDDEFGQTVDTATRPANIVRHTDLPASAEVDVGLFTEPVEQQVWDSCELAREQLEVALKAGADYARAWEVLKTLSKPIDDYFLAVMVNVEDEELRTNRLAVMRELDSLYLRLADFTQIVQ